jgi:DNA-binding transcriptional LysR family regulator
MLSVRTTTISKTDAFPVPFDLRQLRYALVAAECGSFRRAADALRLKQSTLSRCILLMEQRLGTVLFERATSGVRLTPAGAEFLHRARHLIEQAESMTVLAKAVGRGEAGQLTLGFYVSLSAGNLRATLLEYKNRFPKIEVHLVQDSREGLRAGIMKGAIDTAIVTGDPNERDGAAMSLWSERVLVALPVDHPLASREIVYWQELKDETFLFGRIDPAEDFHDLLVASIATPGQQPKIIRNEIGSGAIQSLVGAGFGVTLLCDAYAGSSFAGVVYREVRDNHGPCRIGYSAHWARDNENPALKSLLRLLQERYPVLPAADAD